MEATENIKSKESTKRTRKWHRLRRGVQILALLLFLYLLLGTTQQLYIFLPSDLFFYLDPLAGISAMLASRSWIAPMALGVITLVLTITVGRVWCSWICPMGSLLDWIPSHRVQKDKLDIPRHWRQVKYFLLFIILIGALFGALTLVILDPITLLYRTITSALLPAFSFLITGAEKLLYNVVLFKPAVEWFDTLARGWLLTEQSFFLPNLWILVLFIAVVFLNVVRSRFWCRYLCPLGGLLALVSGKSRIRQEVADDKCISCYRCSLICHTGAIDPANKFAASAAECTTCLECVDKCPTKAIKFTGQHGVSVPQLFDPSRREFLASLGIAAIGAAFLRFTPMFHDKKSQLIRPPGSNEDRLLSQCIRCGECVKVCPTGLLQPSSSLEGLDNLWTPVAAMRPAHCDYSCNACGQVCPTEAIPKLSLEKKQQVVMGKAFIDTNRCIPWAEGRECIVCEEMCPISTKAIRLSGGGGGQGSKATVRRPRVQEDLCIGCGICEAQCPVNGQAAIRVYLSNEIT